ncbi:hypothetical protein FNV43_RR00471 [Rhamnella rubrinervis]|uniref:Uncharacterized protein n=1 Tax=Rhamnella rubrinervis TaxID=2594499 RepID=A0A8K0HP81_9ROSA|nr:hypothetical protein FNV43_RR00471 [Rhamnella rubrinervis]
MAPMAPSKLKKSVGSSKLDELQNGRPSSVYQKQHINGVPNDYGFTVFDPATANEAVTMSKWIKVEKITNTVAKRKEMLARTTGGATKVITRRSSPKKPMQHQGTMTENKIGVGQGNRGLIPTRCSPRKHVQLQRKMTEIDKGEGNGGLKSEKKSWERYAGAASKISSQGHHVPEEGENNENNEPQSPITMNSSGSGYAHEDSMTKTLGTNEDSFGIDTYVENDEAIIGDIGRLYRSHKYKLHKHFLKFRMKEEALRNKHGGSVTDVAWVYLCDHFSDPAFINKLVEAKENNEAEGLGMTMDEIFDSVLPPRKGYVIGLGPGPKPISK